MQEPLQARSLISMSTCRGRQGAEHVFPFEQWEFFFPQVKIENLEPPVSHNNGVRMKHHETPFLSFFYFISMYHPVKTADF